MSTINVKQQNSQADILNPIHSGQIALIWKEIIQGLTWLYKYYEILCKEKSFLLYQ